MKFGYTIIYVPDVEAAVSFYETAFSVPRRFVHESGQYAEMETGQTALAFASEGMLALNGLSAKVSSKDNVAPAIEVALIADDVTAAYRTALAHGALAVSSPATKPWGQEVAYVRDLNGVLVEICSAMNPE